MGRFTPQKAVRTGQKARLALAGPSGSGKTWTALEAATVLGGPVCVLDTERGSASLYADDFEYDTMDWEPPYDPRELAAVVQEQGAKYGTVIIDSLSHFWMGEGGTLDVVDAAAARARGNSYAGWKEGTPTQNDMVTGMLRADCHVIATMRSKTEYVLEERGGKQVPRKLGMAPVQRDGIEYEFTVTADLDIEHTLVVDKTRCRLLAGRAFKLGHTAELAETLRDWLGSAVPFADREVCDLLKARMDAVADDEARMDVKQAFAAKFGRPDRLTVEQAEKADEWLNATLAVPDVPAAPAFTPPTVGVSRAQTLR